MLFLTTTLSFFVYNPNSQTLLLCAIVVGWIRRKRLGKKIWIEGFVILVQFLLRNGSYLGSCEAGAVIYMITPTNHKLNTHTHNSLTCTKIQFLIKYLQHELKSGASRGDTERITSLVISWESCFLMNFTVQIIIFINKTPHHGGCWCDFCVCNRISSVVSCTADMVWCRRYNTNYHVLLFTRFFLLLGFFKMKLIQWSRLWRLRRLHWNHMLTLVV